jgi:hypothetical protein
MLGLHPDLFLAPQDGNIVHFKIKRKVRILGFFPLFLRMLNLSDLQTPLKKLMEAYCQRQSLQLDQIRFLFDGQRYPLHPITFFLGQMAASAKRCF